MIVQIRHYEFNLTEPYEAGKPLSADEAAILNRLRINTIREHFHRRIPRGGALASPDELAKLRTIVAEYDRTYTLAPPPPIRPAWTLDDELRLLEAERNPSPDPESLARRRFTARLTGNLGPTKELI